MEPIWFRAYEFSQPFHCPIADGRCASTKHSPASNLGRDNSNHHKRISLQFQNIQHVLCEVNSRDRKVSPTKDHLIKTVKRSRTKSNSKRIVQLYSTRLPHSHHNPSNSRIPPSTTWYSAFFGFYSELQVGSTLSSNMEWSNKVLTKLPPPTSSHSPWTILQTQPGSSLEHWGPLSLPNLKNELKRRPSPLWEYWRISAWKWWFEIAFTDQ